ncbi:MAG: sensor histidine kinase [Parvularculaceae bacterium]
MTLSHGAGLRLLIVALAILVALQILIVGAGYYLRTVELGRAARPEFIDQIAAAAALIDRTPPEHRGEAIRAIRSPFMSASLSPSFPSEDGGMSDPLPDYRPFIMVSRKALGDRDFKVYARRWRRASDGPPPVFPAEIVLVLRLADGSALVIEPNAQYRRQMAINLAALLSSILGVALLAGLVWASLATSRPLREMAAAVDRLAGDLKAPPIAEKGPGPVRDLARAFNSMQTDLRKLVSERTVALAAIAHDYRTYLTRLRLRVDDIPDEQQRDKAIEDLDQMSALIDDTLLYATINEAPRDLEAFDATALVRDVCDRMTEIGVRLTFAVGEEPAMVQASKPSLRRAVANIIENAGKYGDIAHVAIGRTGDDVVITIADEGPGVPADARARLTEPFYRLESSRSRQTGGSGLGLAIARALIEALNGRLVFGDSEGGGLCVEIAVPAAPVATSV